jgi:dienelactone hydrolase
LLLGLLLGSLLVVGAKQARAQDDTQDTAQHSTLDLQQELRRVVDTVAPKARRQAAIALARRKDVSLDSLLQAVQGFGAFEEHAAGTERVEVPLWNGKSTDATEIFCYVPKSYDPEKPSPLLLTGHGTGGSGRGMTRPWQRLAEKLHMVVVAPSEAGENKGWDFTPRSRTAAMAAVRWARRRFNVDENRVFLTGISRGGHMAWDLALRFPDRFAAIAPMIGGPRLNTSQGQNNLRYIENITTLPIRDLQGSKDDASMVRNLRLAFDKLKRLGAKDARLIEFPELGHSFRFGAVDWEEFFGGACRDPVPKRVVRLCANKSETRAFWVQVVSTDREVQENFRIKVKQKEYAEWEQKGVHLLLVREAERHTGRVEATMLGKGRFQVDARKVRKVRLLLTAAMFERGKPVEVTFNGRKRKHTAFPSKRVLLLEFAERFDRTFLPVAQVDVR